MILDYGRDLEVSTQSFMPKKIRMYATAATGIHGAGGLVYLQVPYQKVYDYIPTRLVFTSIGRKHTILVFTFLAGNVCGYRTKTKGYTESER